MSVLLYSEGQPANLTKLMSISVDWDSFIYLLDLPFVLRFLEVVHQVQVGIVVLAWYGQGRAQALYFVPA